MDFPKLDERRFHLGELLGAGPTCRTFLAQDENRPGHRVVLKIPYEEWQSTEGFQQIFLETYQRLVDLRLPHLLEVLEAGRYENRVYAVLKEAEQGNLETRLQGASCSLASQVLPWLRPVSEALDGLRERGLVHQQVHPRNILFDARGESCLADFGTAQAMYKSASITVTRPIPGAFRYFSPEACKGMALGPASDQYSLACVLYEAIAGRTPHIATSNFQLAIAKLQSPPTSITSWVPELPAEVAGAIMRGLSTEPSQRFSSCRELTEAVAEGFQGQLHPSMLGWTPKAHVPSSDPVLAKDKFWRARLGFSFVLGSLILGFVYGFLARPFGLAPFPLGAGLLSALCGWWSRSSAFAFLTGLVGLLPFAFVGARSFVEWLTLAPVFLGVAATGVLISSLSRIAARSGVSHDARS